MSHQCEHEHDHNHEHALPPVTNGAQSLYPYINTPQVQCLNVNGRGSRNLTECFLKSQDQRNDVSKYLESDADCQMILHIPFTSICRVFSIVLRTSRTASGVASPKNIKMFKNFTKSIDFDTLEESKPLHEVESPENVGIDLSRDSTHEVVDESSFVEHHLPRHLFQNAHCITIFIQNTWSDDDDLTRCFYLEVRGEATGQKTGQSEVPFLAVYESAPNPLEHRKLENEYEASNLGM